MVSGGFSHVFFWRKVCDNHHLYSSIVCTSSLELEIPWFHSVTGKETLLSSKIVDITCPWSMDPTWTGKKFRVSNLQHPSHVPSARGITPLQLQAVAAQYTPANKPQRFSHLRYSSFSHWHIGNVMVTHPRCSGPQGSDFIISHFSPDPQSLSSQLRHKKKQLNFLFSPNDWPPSYSLVRTFSH
jgi:hypothetical protein